MSEGNVFQEYIYLVVLYMLAVPQISDN